MIHFFKRRAHGSKQGSAYPEAQSQTTFTGGADFSATSFVARIFNDRDTLEDFAARILSALAQEMEILQAVFLVIDPDERCGKLKFLSGYAFINQEEHPCDEFSIGEGLPGQVAQDGKMLYLKEVPKGYMTIRTGLGEASPDALIIFPVKHGEEIFGVVELASFQQFTNSEVQFLDDLARELGKFMKHYRVRGYMNPAMAI